jgi:hypothetical protein
MPNGCQFTLNCVLGAKKQLKEVLVVTIWPVYVEKVSVIYVRNLGSLTIKTTLNVTYTKKVPNKA